MESPSPRTGAATGEPGLNPGEETEGTGTDDGEPARLRLSWAQAAETSGPADDDAKERETTAASARLERPLGSLMTGAILARSTGSPIRS